MTDVVVYKPRLPRFAVAAVLTVPIAALSLVISLVLLPIASVLTAIVLIGGAIVRSWQLKVVVTPDAVTIRNLRSSVCLVPKDVEEVVAARAWWGSDDDRFLHFCVQGRPSVGATVTLWPGTRSRDLVVALRRAGFHVAVEAPAAPNALSRKRSVWRPAG